MSKNFFMIPNHIFDLGLSCKAIAVYCCLRRHAGNSADCFPSRALIAKECSLSVSSVDRALKELADRKLVVKMNQTKQNGGKTSNRYFLPDL